MMMSSQVNVLFVLKPVRQAGAEMVLLQAAARLDKRRFRAYLGLLTPDEDHLAPPDLPVINFNLSTLHGPIWVKFLLHLGWVIHKYRIQVVHVNSYVPGNYVRLAAGLIGVPLIIDHWHGFTQLSLKRRLICRVPERFTDLRQAAGSLAATFDGTASTIPKTWSNSSRRLKAKNWPWWWEPGPNYFIAI